MKIIVLFPFGGIFFLAIPSYIYNLIGGNKMVPLDWYPVKESTPIINMFPKIGVPQNGWFIMENPIKMVDLGGNPTIFRNIHIHLISRGVFIGSQPPFKELLSRLNS